MRESTFVWAAGIGSVGEPRSLGLTALQSPLSQWVVIPLQKSFKQVIKASGCVQLHMPRNQEPHSFKPAKTKQKNNNPPFAPHHKPPKSAKLLETVAVVTQGTH